MRYIETIKIIDRAPQNIEAHLARMERAIGKHHHLALNCKINGTAKCRIIYDDVQVHDITYNSYSIPSIHSLKVVETTDIEYAHKYENRDQIALLYAQRGYADDILITRNREVLDTSFCNVVFENSDGLFTPESYLLAGTKRQSLIDVGKIKSIKIMLGDIYNFDRVHLINAMIDMGEVTVNIDSIQL